MTQTAITSFGATKPIENQKDLSFFDGKPIIVILPKYTNPLIGFGVYEKKEKCLYIDDYITGELVAATCGVYSYNTVLFQVILRLDPMELASLVYPDVKFEEPNKIGGLLTAGKINEKLTNSEFWTDLSNYQLEQANKRKYS